MIWPECSTRSFEVGSTTTDGSILPPFIPRSVTLTPIWRDGPIGSSKVCDVIGGGHGTGWSALRAGRRTCSLIGECSTGAAGQWEPYESRDSRTVLRARGGEIPLRDSPCHPQPRSCGGGTGLDEGSDDQAGADA